MKYQIPEALIRFLRIIKLSKKETKQGKNVTYKELSVILGTDDKPAGFIATEGSFEYEEVYNAVSNHEKTHWFFDTFEAAHSFVYGV
jgi:hypothetical protein